MTDWRRRGQAQAAIETALQLPLIVLLVLGVFAVGVIGRADAALVAVTEEAARAAATSTNAREAAAHGIARGQQVADGYRLAGASISVDARDLRPGGQVRVDATVTASLAGISVFGPTQITLHHQHVERVDPYRNLQ